MSSHLKKKHVKCVLNNSFRMDNIGIFRIWRADWLTEVKEISSTKSFGIYQRSFSLYFLFNNQSEHLIFSPIMILCFSVYDIQQLFFLFLSIPRTSSFLFKIPSNHHPSDQDKLQYRSLMIKIKVFIRGHLFYDVVVIES